MAEKLLFGLPVTARDREFHQAVFSEVFGQGKEVLVIGAGLSDIALEPGVTSLDPGYTDLEQMFQDFLATTIQAGDPESAARVAAYLGMDTYSQRIIPQAINPGETLPLERMYDHIVSANCILGGMDEQHTPEELVQLISDLTTFLNPGGAVELFPFFSVSAFDLWIDHTIKPAQMYEAVRQKQFQIKRYLSQMGHPVRIEETWLDRFPYPHPKATLLVGSSL